MAMDGEPKEVDCAGDLPPDDWKLTHFIDYDAPGRRMTRAICGALVDWRDHRNDPTCPVCLARREQYEALEF
jgi:hypothetical protein